MTRTGATRTGATRTGAARTGAARTGAARTGAAVSVTPGSTTRRDRWFDVVFLVGFVAKALDGLAEVLVGLPLLVLRPPQVEAIARWLTAGELREDPDDLLAHLVRHGVATLGAEATLLAAVYLVVHGLVKLGIVAAVVRGSRRLYPWAVVALAGFVVWQAVEFVIHPGVGLALLTVFDVVVVVLTIREWRHHRGLGDVVRSLLPAAWSRGRAG